MKVARLEVLGDPACLVEMQHRDGNDASQLQSLPQCNNRRHVSLPLNVEHVGKAATHVFFSPPRTIRFGGRARDSVNDDGGMLVAEEQGSLGRVRLLGISGF